MMLATGHLPASFAEPRALQARSLRTAGLALSRPHPKTTLATRRAVVTAAATKFPNREGSSAKPVPSKTLEGEELEKWTECVSMLVEVGLDDRKADEVLTRAFGWGSQMYWRKSRLNQVPDPAEVQGSLNFIQEMMENKQSDVLKVIEGFPESVGIGVEDGPPGLKYASEYMESDWKMKGKAKTMTLAKKPQLLGCQIDCRGDCAGQCHYCWATV